MKKEKIIVIGSGMGGMTAASLLSSDGHEVTVLEAAHVPGGCSSSYKRKGFLFESGATTLIGFDEHQPLRYLEEKTGLNLPREELVPSMNVWQQGKTITRFKSREKWLEESISHFGNAEGQNRFWELAFRVSDLVWKVSLRNPLFPPQNFRDLLQLMKNNSLLDVWVLKYALKSVSEVIEQCGISNPEFNSFIDEQLMITAQSKSNNTPFLFGAPGITYTNYSNYYVEGGLLEMIRCLENYISKKGGEVRVREKVESLFWDEGKSKWQVHTSKNNVYSAPVVISNIPVWNMKDITISKVREYFESESESYEQAWGAITIGIGMNDDFPDGLPLHHQIHAPENLMKHAESESVFVSFSKKGDLQRAPEGKRSLNVSTHANPEYWFSLNGSYDETKNEVENNLVTVLERNIPGFKSENIEVIHTATPVTWQNWVYRKKGRVGGIPQSMERSILDWTPNKTPFEGLYLTGDTTYPGQGIPGVTLSGINVYYRIKQNI